MEYLHLPVYVFQIYVNDIRNIQETNRLIKNFLFRWYNDFDLGSDLAFYNLHAIIIEVKSLNADASISRICVIIAWCKYDPMQTKKCCETSIGSVSALETLIWKLIWGTKAKFFKCNEQKNFSITYKDFHWLFRKKSSIDLLLAASN